MLDSEQQSSGFFQRRMLSTSIAVSTITSALNGLSSLTNVAGAKSNGTSSNSPVSTPQAAQSSPVTVTLSVTSPVTVSTGASIITNLVNVSLSTNSTVVKSDTTKPAENSKDTNTPPTTLLAGVGGQVDTNAPTQKTKDTNSPSATDPIAAYYATAATILGNILDKQLSAPVSDSPFDSLDRVSDFYASYMLKFLRQEGDSRAINPQYFVDYLEAKTQKQIDDYIKINPTKTAPKNLYAQEPKAHPDYRFIYAYIQVSVQSGTKPNCMTGVRIKLSDKDISNGVKIIRVHPTRYYDLDSVAYGDSQNYSAMLSGNGTVGATPVTVSGTKNSSAQGEERQHFMNRIGKIASFVDAPNGVFGWDFYPSNQHVSKLNPFLVLLNLFAGIPKLYNTESYLEGGGRDCFVYFLVPWNYGDKFNPSIKASVYSYYSHFNPDGYAGSDNWANDEKVPWHENNQFEIQIPEANPFEQIANLPKGSLEIPNEYGPPNSVNILNQENKY